MTSATFERETDDVARFERVHRGQGEIGMKYFFDTARRASPATLMMYVLPPGTSEGTHAHRGSYDEFYYIVSGRGEMDIAGEKIRVKKGDHVLTPSGVPHGIRNTAARGDLKVYLVVMRR